MTTHVTIGAKVEFDDYIRKNLGGGPAGEWPVRKSAQIGDSVVILIPSMHGDLRAYGNVASEPTHGEWGNSPRYFVSVENLHAIDPPVPIGLIRQVFPHWSWAGYARSYTTVPDELSEEFWRLITNPPIACDNEEPPERVDSVISRIIRDTTTANNLKKKYDFECQVCNTKLPYGDNQYYIEVHHIRPLGQPHDGPDSESNMIVLCPNHHALFDLGVPRFVDESTVEILGKRYALKLKHRISKENVRYYSKQFQRGIA